MDTKDLLYRVFPSCPSCLLCSFSVTSIDDMHPPAHVIACREIIPKVPAAALLAPERGAGNQSRDGDEMNPPPPVGIGRGRSAALLRLVGLVERRDRALQILPGPEQPSRPPHELADLVGKKG